MEPMSTSLPDWAPHLDHELSQLIRLQQIMDRPDYVAAHAEPIRRAIDVAYASHFRALIEFFYDGRPNPKPMGTDLTYRDIAGSPSPFRPYSEYAKRRLTDADQLVGHLTKVRSDRTSDWGSEQDWSFMWPMIHSLLGISELAGILPETVAAVMEAGLTS